MEKRQSRGIDEIHAGADTVSRVCPPRLGGSDLILIQADTVDETVSFIRNYVESIAPEPAMDDPITPSAQALTDVKPAEVVHAAVTAVEKF